MFTCSVFLAAELAAVKWNQAWHSSDVIGAKREKDSFKNGGEVKRLKECFKQNKESSIDQVESFA